MFPREQVVGEWRRVCQALQRRVQEAGVPQVTQPGAHTVDPLPLHGEALGWEEHLLRRGDAVTRGPAVACGEQRVSQG